jgi:gluconolactonase
MKLWILIFTFCALATGQTAASAAGGIERLNPALDKIVAPSAAVEALGGGLSSLEGPLWVRKGGYLLFSGLRTNAIHKWTPEGGVTVYLADSGYTGNELPEEFDKGPNGLTLDKQGRLIVCQQGNRQVMRLEKDGKLILLADRYQGKHLNSPNDVVRKSDGALYFTDPPYGMPKGDKDPKKELSFDGVYRLAGGELQLAATVPRCNGLAFSPGEKYLYVTTSGEGGRGLMRFEVGSRGTLDKGKLFFDLARLAQRGGIDGIKVDKKGNIYCAGPGGIWIVSPEGAHLGTIRLPGSPSNCTFGDKDGKTLYMTGRKGLYRIRLNVAGLRP